ncbi:MAG: 3-oxoacid CoA-transferase subunit B [Candidatus Latescibacteria bacterium]|nr:3-oxoacid CoA-transferase subunit B [Candidatus Latescibacterota bacterium]
MAADRDSRRDWIARRAAMELRDGDVVNLGIGLPTTVAGFVPPGIRVVFQSENGVLGLGPRPAPGDEDADLIDAGGGYVTVVPGACFFDSAAAFNMIRGGHIDVAILGALQVDELGNLANYIIPGKRVPGIGGGMDVATGARRVIGVTELMASDGTCKLVPRCTLPLTAAGEVNLIITDYGVIEVTPEGLVVQELAPDVQPEDLTSRTAARLRFIRKL